MVKTSILTGLFLIPSVYARAETFAEKTLAQKSELILPQRITVGPNDNFQTAITKDGKNIFYSSNTHLAVRIFEQLLESSSFRALVGEKADSKDPMIDPAGTQLAFTSFQTDARGDICIYRLEDKGLRCVTGRDSEDRSPFWIGSDRIGFLTRKNIEEPLSLMVLSLKEEHAKPTRLFSGNLADPTSYRDRNSAIWLAYTRIQDGRSSIELRMINDTEKGPKVSEPVSFSIDLPGLSSFPQFDPVGNFLYFGQYTSDTNDDAQVDARDKSAIFRVSLDDIIGKAEIYPEPLTSIQYNCNYPVPTEFGLFMTCASPSLTNEGALDIYHLPLTGMIPSEWDEKTLLRAIETSRAYSDRVLLFQALIARFRDYRNSANIERILSNSIADGQISAAIFYSDQLANARQVRHRGEANIYKLLSLYLRADRDSKQAGESARSEVFRSKISIQIQAAARIASNQPEWNRLVEAGLNGLSGRSAEARRILNGIVASKIRHPLALYYYNELSDLFAGGKSLDRLAMMSQSKILDENARVFYAYEFLRVSDRGAMKEHQDSRRVYLSGLVSKITDKSNALASLIQFDLKLNEFKSDDVKDLSNQRVYADLLKALGLSQGNYFLYRAMFSRAILKLSSQQFWNYMAFFSSRWISNLLIEDSEYPYARRAYLNIGLEESYGLYGRRQYGFAGDQFSITARLTDDLEAHHGFIRSRLAQGQRVEIDKMYESLKKDRFIDENLTYVRALLSVLDGDQNFRSTLSKLEGMSSGGFNPGLRFMLMGYLSHRLYNLSSAEGESNAKYFQDANRYYMLALDLSTGNERVVSNLLMDLGLLHQQAANHGQSLSFLDLRKDHFFETNDERAAFLWIYSRAYFYNQQPARAYQVINEFVSKSSTQSKYPEFFEKAGFYAAQARDYRGSCSAYEAYFKLNPMWASNLTAADTVRTRMGYGYALLKSKRVEEAQRQFNSILGSSSISNLNLEAGHSLPIAHYHQLALGFLAQMADKPSTRIDLLSRRIQIIRSFADNLNQVFMRREDWLRTVITIQNQIAEAAIELNDSKRSASELSNSLGALSDYQKAVSNPVDTTYVQGLRNFFALGDRVERDQIDRALSLAAPTYEALERSPELRSTPEFASFERELRKFKK